MDYSQTFSQASQSTISLNPHLFPATATMNEMCRTKIAKPKMNKTEREYSLILEAMKRKGEILRYEYEGATFRWADMKYTPDFIVFGSRADSPRYFLKLVEVKGGHIWDRDIVRFKGARAYWPEFEFEMHQKKNGEWKRIH